MARYKKKTFSGAVCEQEVFSVSDGVRNPERAPKRLRFKSEEDRLSHRLHISKKKHAQLFNENFSTSSLYSTLTFDDENECHTVWEAKRLRDLYFRRLRYAFPEAVIFLYIGRGKNTNRFHLHAVTEGVPEEEVLRKWTYGTVVQSKRLRDRNFYNGIDYGRDYTGLANYLFDHWTEEIGGHRWKMSRNARRPQAEKMTEVLRDYSLTKPPAAPRGYRLVESKATSYGYLYYKYVKDDLFTKRE